MNTQKIEPENNKMATMMKFRRPSYRRVIEIEYNGGGSWIKVFFVIQLLKSKLFIIIGYILFARQI